jgi:hypothetical protein
MKLITACRDVMSDRTNHSDVLLRRIDSRFNFSINGDTELKRISKDKFVDKPKRVIDWASLAKAGLTTVIEVEPRRTTRKRGNGFAMFTPINVADLATPLITISDFTVRKGRPRKRGSPPPEPVMNQDRLALADLNDTDMDHGEPWLQRLVKRMRILRTDFGRNTKVHGPMSPPSRSFDFDGRYNF